MSHGGRERLNTLPRSCCKPWDRVAYVLPVLLLGLLGALYWLLPHFYLTYVLEISNRESQAVELVTVLATFTASILLLWSASKLWHLPTDWMCGMDLDPRDLRGPKRLRGRGGALIVGAVGLASFFFAGEEVNWGQNIFGWASTVGLPRGMNVHNNAPISVQGLGTFLLCTVFFVIPVVWRGRRYWPQIADWAPAVAEGPVIWVMAVAVIWAEVKVVYTRCFPHVRDIDRETQQTAIAQIKGEASGDLEWAVIHYAGFFEQIKEHKEMLVAVALLLYALYRVAKVKRLSMARSA